MNITKNLVVLSLLLTFLFTFSGAKAQNDEITDEDLWKYAMLESVVDAMKADISNAVNDMIKTQEGIDGKRYKELAGVINNNAKLKEMDAKEFEIKFVKLVEKVKSERIEAIKVVNQELATKMVGDNGKKYKTIKDALKNDASLEAKFKEIKESIEALK